LTEGRDEIETESVPGLIWTPEIAEASVTTAASKMLTAWFSESDSDIDAAKCSTKVMVGIIDDSVEASVAAAASTMLTAWFSDGDNDTDTGNCSTRPVVVEVIVVVTVEMTDARVEASVTEAPSTLLTAWFNDGVSDTDAAKLSMNCPRFTTTLNAADSVIATNCVSEMSTLRRGDSDMDVIRFATYVPEPSTLLRVETSD